MTNYSIYSFLVIIISLYIYIYIMIAVQKGTTKHRDGNGTVSSQFEKATRLCVVSVVSGNTQLVKFTSVVLENIELL